MKVKLNLGVAKTPQSEIKKKIKISKQGIQVRYANQVVDKWNIDPALIKETCQNLLNSLKEEPEIEPFLELVSREDYPDYFELIESPISIAEISKKVSKSQYTEMNEFKDDVMLMFANCKMYNQPGSAIFQQADRLLDSFLKKYDQMRQGGAKRHLKVSLAKPVPETGYKAMFEYAKTGNFQAFRKGLDSITDVNTLYEAELFDAEFTWCLIHACCYYGQLEMIELLMKKGADPEIEDTWYGGRPLAWACFGGHYKICKTLIEDYDVDKDARNQHGQNAFELLPEKSAQFVRLFEDKKPIPKSESRKSSIQTPVTIKIPPKTPATAQSTPMVAQATPTPAAALPKANLSMQHQQYLQQQQLLAAVKSARRVDARRTVYVGSTPSNLPQAQKYHLPQYSAFLATYKPFESGEIVEEVHVSTNDGSFDETLNMEQLGHVIVLPKTATSVQINLATSEKCTAGGYVTNLISVRNETMQKTDPLSFSKNLEVIRALEGHTSYFEMVVSSKNDKQNVFLAFIRQ